MKKKKFLKTASIVALSAVMCGTTLAATACSGGDSKEYELDAFIFCSATDAATNQKICDTWAEEYTQKLRASGELSEDEPDITVNLTYQTNSGTYSTQLDNLFSKKNAAPDVFYLSPKYIRTWAKNGRVLDISKYLTDENAAKLNGLWLDSVGFYGYSEDASYVQGERIQYDADGKDGAGMYTLDGETKVGLYGLPKDYSNFAMAYNANYYTEDMKNWMQTYGPATSRTVQGAYERTSKLTFTGESGVVTYAVDGTYTNTVTGETITAVKGQDAPFIAVGVPVNIKPYNFYRFNSYYSAVAGGDPIALATMTYTNDEGYIVTIPGFPGDTFTVSDEDVTGGLDGDAPYATTRGYTVFTYAEYGALTWLTTYFCNTFNWWDATNNGNTDGTNGNASLLLSGTGGMVTGAKSRVNVYGCGQYEAGDNPMLYTLPWLYGNDSDFINEASTQATNPGVAKKEVKGTTTYKDYVYTDTSDLDTIAKMIDVTSQQVSESRQKMSLNGDYRNVDVYYGVDSYNFLEMYGAFIEYGSTWNGNLENCGDVDEVSSNSWAQFRAGNNIFYGSGTWDAQARNESDFETYCTFATMPSAIAEKYALYSHVKDAFYNQQTYAWISQDVDSNGTTYQTYWNGQNVVKDNNNERIVEDTKINYSDTYLKVFTEDEIKANQVVRQDKWGARMDSVGYSANAQLEELAGTENEWKIEAAAELVQALSINEEGQVTLSYGGAQLPNFITQCEDFLYYNIPDAPYWSTAGKSYDEGAFVKMLTPEGFYDTGYWDYNATTGEYTVNAAGAAEAAKIWSHYYQIVKAMDELAQASSTKTVKEVLSAYKAYDGGELVYDTQYDDVVMKDFTKDSDSYRAYAMKILYMQTYTLSDRDLQVRMQYGLNSARDATMYTYTITWAQQISTREGSSLKDMLQAPLDTTKGIESYVQRIANGTVTYYQTAAVHCLKQSQLVAYNLAIALYSEEQDLEYGF